VRLSFFSISFVFIRMIKNRSWKVGKHMSNYGTQAKEKARQQKQTDKASKRILARQKKAFMKKSPPTTGSETVEPL
jgi:hypothetical protein